MSAEELWRMPDEGARPELVRGELRVITPAGAEHGRVAMTPAGAEHRRVAMTPAGAEHGRAAMTPAGAEHGRVAMTLGLLLAGHVRQHGIGIAFEEKALMWLQGGATAVLVLDPARKTATVYRGAGEARIHTGQETIDPSDAVPGWRVTVAELFG
ncbi:MAG: hypothetical protein JO046_10935 [Solirubrobacterales bacterium]|nr:hypothetical protein [Solirubrobacterales bacterium]